MNKVVCGHWSATGAGDFGCKYIKKRCRKGCAASYPCQYDVSKGMDLRQLG
jgi:hypothetical protein